MFTRRLLKGRGVVDVRRGEKSSSSASGARPGSESRTPAATVIAAVLATPAHERFTSRTPRNPMLSFRLSGSFLLRLAVRRFLELLFPFLSSRCNRSNSHFRLSRNAATSGRVRLPAAAPCPAVSKLGKSVNCSQRLPTHFMNILPLPPGAIRLPCAQFRPDDSPQSRNRPPTTSAGPWRGARDSKVNLFYGSTAT